MKILKFISYLFIAIALILVTLYLYFNSVFVEVPRLKGQIEENLNVKLSALPRLVDRDSYGGIEHGGDKALLKLNASDCKAVSQAIINSKTDSNERRYIASNMAAYNEMFRKNNLYPKRLKTWFQPNSHGDYVSYALDVDECVLFRQYYFE